MKFKMRKKYQRKLNKVIKEINKNVAEDNLWQGRYEFRQKRAEFFKFDDNSGGNLDVEIRAYDKKTGYYRDFYLTYSPWEFADMWFWRMMNDFITVYTDTWEETPNPREKGFAKDYTNIHITDKIMQLPDNFILNYKHWHEQFTK